MVLTDIDWEYPNMYSDRPGDKANFVSLLNDIKSMLGSRYLVTTAIAAGAWRTGQAYNIPGVFAAVDFVNLMTYDMHGGWEGKTGIHAPLYKSSLDNTDSNVDAAVKLLVNAGVNKNKLIMGIPTYGNAFTLSNPSNNRVGAPASGAGSLTYYQICSALRSNSLTEVWDDSQKVPYAFRGTQWVGYDNVRSVNEKALYINSNQLGGAMFWAVDDDDYNNVCGGGKYPLISKVYSIVVGGSVSDTQPVSREHIYRKII